MNDIFFSENYAVEPFKTSHGNLGWTRGRYTAMYKGTFLVNRDTPFEKDIEIIRLHAIKE